MLHKAWNSKGEMAYHFPRSSVKFQGHTVQSITDFDPDWAFPDYRPVAAFKSLRFALFVNIKWDHRLYTFSETISLATDRLSWLLTYISFVADHRWTFRSIIDIVIDSIHIGRRIFSVNHSGARCLQPRVNRDPHTCVTIYLMSWHSWDFKTSKHWGVPPKLQGRIWDCNLMNDIKQCEIVLFSIYSPRKTGIFSLNGVALCFTIPTQPVHRTKDDTHCHTASSTGR